MRKTLQSAWKVLKWPLLLLVLIYIGFVIKEIHWPVSQAKTDAAIAEIKAAKITPGDVDGSNLPPQPDPAKNDATIEGIDANHNGIRDDVELAIFKKYPSDKKLRAAELQYAKELQLNFTSVLNTDTWRTLAVFEGNGIACLVNLGFERYNDMHSRIYVPDSWEKEVRDLVFNTSARMNKYTDNERFASSFASHGDEGCDLK